MLHHKWNFLGAIAIWGLILGVSPVRGQRQAIQIEPQQPNIAPKIGDGRRPAIRFPELPARGIVDQPHEPLPGEEIVDDLRGWLDGTNRPRGKNAPINPKMLEDLIRKLDQQRLQNPQDNNPADIQRMLRENPQFRDPEMLRKLQDLRKDPNMQQRLNQELDQVPPKDRIRKPIQDREVPALKDQFGQLIDQAKQPPVNPNNMNPMDQQPPVNPNQFPGNPPEQNAPPLNQQMPRPKLDPVAEEWVKWLEKNMGDSPASQKMLKDLTDAMGKNNFQGMFDKFPELKNGGWGDFDKWGQGNFGEGWKIRPPDWNFNGQNNMGGGGLFGNGGGGGNWFGGGGGGGGGGSSGGLTFSGGGVSGNAAGGGVSILFIILAVIGGLILGYILFNKWQQQKAATLGLADSLKTGFDLSRINSREELVEAFDHLTVEKCGDESRNWNHRVITLTWAESAPAVTEPAVELGELYQKARYAPPQDDMTRIELSTAERDIQVIARVNP